MIDIFDVSDAIQEATRGERERMGRDAWEMAVDDACHLVVERFNQRTERTQRWAKVYSGGAPETGHERCERVRAYMPANYKVTGFDTEYVYITGFDNSGWTLDGYVIPRLASGLSRCEEILPA